MKSKLVLPRKVPYDSLPELLARHHYSEVERDVTVTGLWQQAGNMQFRVLSRTAFWLDPGNEGVVLESGGFKSTYGPIEKYSPVYLVGQHTQNYVSSRFPYNHLADKILNASRRIPLRINGTLHKKAIKIVDWGIVIGGLVEEAF